MSSPFPAVAFAVPLLLAAAPLAAQAGADVRGSRLEGFDVRRERGDGPSRPARTWSAS